MAYLTLKTKLLRPAIRRKAGLILIAFWLGLLLSNLGQLIGRHYQFALNETDSLPNWAFIIDKAQLKPRRYDYYTFVAPPNPYYPKGSIFTKQVVGIAGDMVTIKARTFYINDRPIGQAKAFDRLGHPTLMAGAGIIPKGYYFMVTPSPNSLDSRYAQIGLIEQARLIGRAHPVM